VAASERLASKVAPMQEDVLKTLKEAPVKNVDETGFHVGGKTQWLHVLSNDQMTHYRISKKRSDLDPLQTMKGTVVHDHFKPYFKLEGMIHALCNAHHLRELKALMDIEEEPWAFEMHQFLKMLNRWPNIPKMWMNDRYNEIIGEGLVYHQSLPSFASKSRKRRIGHNLLMRLRDYKSAVLGFAYDPRIPFTNNQAEQDVRMMKVKQKISGGFRTLSGAQTFATIRGFISTTRKQNNNILHALSSQLA
jgi:transposase